MLCCVVVVVGRKGLSRSVEPLKHPHVGPPVNSLVIKLRLRTKLKLLNLDPRQSFVAKAKVPEKP